MALSQKKKYLPPSPTQGFEQGLVENDLDTMFQLFKTYGDIYQVYAPQRQTYTYVISHPEYIKHVLARNYKNYIKGIGIERVRILLGNGIMASEGEFWKKQRRMIQPAFHRRAIGKLSGLMSACNTTLLQQWLAKAERGDIINVSEDTSQVTLEIVLKALFGEDLDDFQRRGGNPFVVVKDDPARNLEFARKFRALGGLVLDIVNERRKTGRRGLDILSMLIEARDEQTGEPMADKHLVNEVLTLIVAGHETTASALNWTWYLLSQHPAVQDQLHQELERELGGHTPSMEDLSKLPYTHQIMDEALRLYPPGWLLTRRALGEDEIGGYYVVPKTDIFLCPYIVHRHPDFWTEPEAFKPERFEPERSKERHRYAYFPFAAGPRRCIGDFFAMTEMQMHLAIIAQRLRLVRADDKPIAMEPEVNLRMKDNLFMRAICRHMP